jgi:hypothetical protein
VNLKTRTYQAIWQRCRQFQDQQMSITVPDEDEETGVRSIGFNVPVRNIERLIRGAQKQGMPPEEIERRVAALTRQLAEEAAQMGHPDPMAAANEQLNAVSIENRPAEMDVDLIIEPATESINMRQEMSEVLAQRQDVPLELLIDYLPVSGRERRKFRDKLKQARADQAEAAQMAQQVAVEDARSKIEKNRAGAMKDMAQAEEIEARTQQTRVSTAHQVEVGPYGPPEQGAEATQ